MHDYSVNLTKINILGQIWVKKIFARQQNLCIGLPTKEAGQTKFQSCESSTFEK